ncbi:MAG: hypothetical protein KDD14_18745 [Saprospiraceae bacterium]|nr:hypothetical protein [Saprospiraceae bacterium]
MPGATFWLQNLWIRRLTIVLFIGTIVLELYQLTWWRGQPTNLISPVVWLLSGSLTAVLGWMLAVHAARHGLEINNAVQSNGKVIFKWLLFLVGLVIGIKILHSLYQEIPEINNFSDILPAKREYIRRFLSGEIVYRPIPFEYYNLEPTFLPFRWLPFVVAQVAGFDYRWISFGALAIGLAVWNARPYVGKNIYLEIIVKCLLPFYCLQSFVRTDNIALAAAVELLIAGYYLIFTRYFFNKNPFVVALVLTICLLSRYSVILWLPLLFLVLWKEYDLKYILRVGAYTLLGVFLIYFLPFCLHDYGKHFFAAAQYYLNASFGTWTPEVWLPEGSLPLHHSRGVGFSLWFILKAPGELRHRFDLMLQVAFLFQIALTLFFSIVYWFRVRGNDRYVVFAFLLASLKVFMMVFNGFLVAPFSYLFEVSFYLSFPLLFILPITNLWRKLPVLEMT